MSNSNSNITIIITAENKAGQVLQQVQQQGGQIQDTLTKKNEEVAQSVKKVEANYLQASAAFAAVGATVVGFATSLDNMERAQLKADIAQKRVNDLMREGKQGTEEFRIAQEKLRLAQDNVSDTYTNFVANIGPQIFTTIFGLQSGFRALGITSVSQLIPAITGVGTAMKAAFLTPPPIGLIIAGVATVVILLATNAGGLRDAVVKLGDEIFRFIQQHLRPLADLLSWLNDNVVQPLAHTLGITAVESTEKAEGAFNGLQQETVNLGHGIGIAADIIKDQLTPALDPGLTTASDNVTKVLTGTEAVVQRNIEQFGAMGRTALKTAEDIQSSSVQTITGLSAIEAVLKRIQELQGQKDTRSQAEILGFYNNPLGGQRFSADTAASYAMSRAGARDKVAGVAASNAAIDQQIQELFRQAQSFALAAGISPFSVFGGGIRSGNSFFSTDLTQLVSGAGTLISSSVGLRPGIDITVQEAIARGLGLSSFDVNAASQLLAQAQAGQAFNTLVAQLQSQGSSPYSAQQQALNMLYGNFSTVQPSPGTIRDFTTLSREQFFNLTRAQHGFEGFVNSPTLFLAGEAGPEHVRITPGGKGVMKLVVQIIDASGNELGSSTLDDVNKEGVIRIKTRGVRLF